MFRSRNLVILALAGALLASFLISRLRTGAETERAPSEVAGEDLILEEFRELVERGEAVVVDARPEVFHRLGHVPGALSLPVKDFKASYAKHRSRLEADKRALVVVYCSNEACEDSTLVGEALKKLGYTQVAIFKGGWEEWTDTGLPEERT